MSLILKLEVFIQERSQSLSYVGKNIVENKIDIKIGDFFLGWYWVYKILPYRDIEHPFVLSHLKMYNLDYSFRLKTKL